MAQDLMDKSTQVIPFYYITDCNANARVRIPELSEAYQKLLQEEQDGMLERKNPRIVEVSHHTKVTAEMIKAMEIKFNERGEFMTDDPWLAHKMHVGGKTLSRFTKWHPNSMKLPDEIPDGPSVDTLRKLGLAPKKSAKPSTEKS